MFERFLFIIKYWLGWVLFFSLARIGFLLSNMPEVKKAGSGLAFSSLFYGLRMDFSMAAYITLPVCLLVISSVFAHFLRKPIVYQVYTAVLLFFALLALFADIGLFKAWGSRLDATPLKYLSNPKEVWASIGHLPVGWILLGLVLLYLALLYLSNRLLRRWSAGLMGVRGSIYSFSLCLLLTAAMIIPLRGGLQLAPLNQSSVYFSQNNFANMAAINAPWNFLYALNHRADDKTNPFNVLDAKQAAPIRDSLFAGKGAIEKIIDLTQTYKPNVIVIAWESLTSKAINLEKDGVTILPGFQKLIKDGLFFSNIYASGDRTDKGIVAILSGYPAQPTTSIVKIPAKAAKLPMLSKVFHDSGYSTSFHYGGELEFANIKAYLLQGAFGRFVSVKDFNEKDKNSKWGAHDGVVMKKLVNDLSGQSQPFFSVWLTLSSHEPYEIPTTPALKGKDDVSQFLSSLHYTDSVVYDFIESSKRQSWWQHTVVIIVADHGHRLMSTGKKADDFRIPLLILGGALKTPGTVNREVGAQTDIAATLLGQLAFDARHFNWSKNLLDSTTPRWGYFSFNNGFGYVEPGSRYVFDNVGKMVIEKEGALSNQGLRRGAIVQQLSFQDYLDK